MHSAFRGLHAPGKLAGTVHHDIAARWMLQQWRQTD